MRFNRRSLSLTGLALIVLAVVFAACTDDGTSPVIPEPPVVTPPPPDPNGALAIPCRADVRTRQVSCAAGPNLGDARGVIVGGQNKYVKLMSSDVVVTDASSTAETGDSIFAFDVQVQNIFRQPTDGRVQKMGTSDGTTLHPDGIRVFFYSLTGNGGEASVVNADGMGTFTSGNQEYFQYNSLLEPGATSSEKQWQIYMGPGLTTFDFLLFVSTEVPLRDGWVDIHSGGLPADTVLIDSVGASVALVDSVRGFAGQYDDTLAVTWTSANSGVASVSPAGVVTADSVGTDTVRAATVVPGQYGTVVIIVSNKPTVTPASYDALENVTLPVADSVGLMDYVNDPDGDAVIVADSIDTPHGTAIVAADGSFRYRGDAGYSGPDNFQYTVRDGVTTRTGTVNITVNPSRYWYVKADAEGITDGRQDFPFATFAAAQAVAIANDSILVLHSDSALVGAVALENGQGLIGQGIGASLTRQLNGVPVVVLATGAAPNVTRTDAGAAVTLAQDNHLAGLGITSAGTGIQGASFDSLTLTIVGVHSAGPALDLSTGTVVASGLIHLASTNSAGAGLVLNGVHGTLVANGGAISNAAGPGVQITGGTVNFTYAGNIGAIGAGAAISGRTGGALSFGGNVTAGGAVTVQGTTGGSVTFSGSVTAPGGVHVTGTGAGSVSFLGSVASSAEGIVVSNGTAGTVLFGGALTLSGKGIRARGNTGGSISFAGSAKSVSTADSAGVDLTNNNGATISFPNGGLAITVAGGAGAGFRATGGGLLAVDSAGTTVTTATGPGLTLNKMNTGAAPVGFRSVATAAGAPYGIQLDSLTGTGGVAVLGGTIRKPAGHGIRLAVLALVPVQLTGIVVDSAGAGGNAGISTSEVLNLGVTGMSVVAAGGPALSLDSTTLTGSFANLTSTGSSSSALILNRTRGTALASAGTLSGATSTTVAVIGGSVEFIYQGSVSQANNAALLSVTNKHTGELNFQGAVQATNGTGLQFTDADGSYIFGGTTTLNGGAAGIDVLGGSGGSFNFAATSSIANPSTGPALNVAASAPDSLVYAGTITNNVGRAVVVDGLTGGTVAVSGAISGSGANATGILVQNNTGGTTQFTGATTLTTAANDAVTLSGNAEAATIRFAGGPLLLSTTTGTAFNANGGGTLIVTGSGNTIAASAGVGARILNTRLDGTGGVVFQTINAAGGASGIILQNTNTGVFGVTGTGGAGTGGSITGTTGPAVSLTSTAGATLNRMNLTAGTGATAAAINGSSFGTLTSRGTALTAGNGPALLLNTGTMNADTFSTVGGTLAGTVKGVSLTSVGGSFAVSGGTLTGALDSVVVVRGGTVSAGWSGTITQANNLPLLAVVGTHQTGTLAFGAALTATNGPGLQFNDADGSYQFTGNVTLNGGNAGIDVTGGSGGTFGFSSTTAVTNPTGELIQVASSSPNFTYSGSLSKTNAGVGILVQSSGGSVTITGDATTADGDAADVTRTLTTGASNAVNLLNNTGTVTIQGGGLVITTTTGNGLNATGGGTVNVTGAGNTAASTGGIPVNIQNTTVGASGVAFRSVNATGGANGIVLNNTGNSGGGFTVTGDGESSAANATRGRTTVPQAGGGSITLGSGGTISGTTGSGVSLTSANTVVLRNQVIQNNSGDGITATTVSGLVVDNARITGHASDHGILGTTLTGLTLTHVEVESNATTDGVVEGPDIWNVRLVNFAGTGVIQNSRLRQAEETVLGVVNDLGTGTLTITNTNITDAGTTAGNGVQITARGTSNLTLTMQNDSVNRTKARGVTAVADGSATLAVNVSGSKFRDNFAGLEVAHTSLGPTTYNLTGNDFQWHESVPININRGSLGATPVTGSFRGTVESNTIGTAAQLGSGSSTADAGAPGGRGQGGVGIRLVTNGAGGDTRIRVKNNIVRQVINIGVNILGRDGAHRVDAILEGNDVELPNHAFIAEAVYLQAGATTTDQVTMCVDARTNRAVSPLLSGLRVRTNSGINTTTNNQIPLAQWDGVTAVNTFLANQNPTLGDNVNTSTTGGPFVATPSCNAP